MRSPPKPRLSFAWRSRSQRAEAGQSRRGTGSRTKPAQAKAGGRGCRGFGAGGRSQPVAPGGFEGLLQLRVLCGGSCADQSCDGAVAKATRAGRSRCNAKAKLEPGEAVATRRQSWSRAKPLPREAKIGARRSRVKPPELMRSPPKPRLSFARRSRSQRAEAGQSRPGTGSRTKPAQAEAGGLGCGAFGAGASELVAEASLWRQVGPKVCCSSMYFMEVVSLIEAAMVL